jgi:hypothetical protein
VRQLRWLIFNLLSVLCLLLCIAAIAMWVRSYYRIDSVIHFMPRDEQKTMWIDHHTMVTIRSGPVYEADSRRGELRLLYLVNDGSYYRCEASRWTSYRFEDEELLRDMPPAPWIPQTRVGFAIEHQPVSGLPYNLPPGTVPTLPTAYTIHAIYTPWWLWVGVFAVLPGRRAIQMARAKRRRRKGRCERCGYDMRATPDRCPECGNVPRS